MEPYDAAYFEETHRNWFAHPNLQLFEKIARLIDREPGPASLIDVGCGNGDLLRFLATRLASAAALTGVDLVANAPESGVEFIQGDMFALDIDRKFSIVVSLMTIEHIADIRAFVRRLKSLVRPGGLVVINTINDESTLYEAARMLRRFGIALPFDRLYSRHHLHHFSRASLSLLLESEELQVADVILCNAPLASLDIPVSSRVAALILLGGVSSLFALSSISGRTYSQTVVCRRGAR
jgi:2-polyprenyl-3-methyl-5-hydroxy-6-metoxy-1,4-benzoquinol methylase